MKVAMVTYRFFPYIGGVETVVLQLASIMTSMGIDVTILTQTGDKKLPREENINGFNIKRFHEVGFNDLEISFGLFKYLQENAENYDLIHSHNYHTFAVLCAALTKKKPIILSPHYHGTGQTFLTRFLHFPYRYLGKFIFSQTNEVICDSQSEAELVKLHFSNVTKINIIPLGIETKILGSKKKKVPSNEYILSVGRLVNYKNVDLLINSLQFIDRNINLLIIGNGPELFKLKALTNKLNLSKRITFFSKVSSKDLHYLYKNAKTYVSMSSMEAYGLSLLDAVNAGIGIVASNISPHLELIERYNIHNVLTLDPKTSPTNLAKSISVALNTSTYTTETLPSWESVAKQTVRIYSDNLNK